MTNEVLYIVYGYRVGRLFVANMEYEGTGSPGYVSFDYNNVDDTKLVGFYHTHPYYLAYPSQTDIDTMQAWCTMSGKELLCFIDSPIDGLKCYLFNDETFKEIKSFLRLGNKFVGYF